MDTKKKYITFIMSSSEENLTGEIQTQVVQLV